MLPHLDLDQIQKALQTRAGLIELAVILACFAVGWTIDRRVRLGKAQESRVAQIGYGSVNRLLLPLTTLVLLFIARAAFAKWHAPALFAVVIPLALALALIRLAVYALRRLFGASKFAATSERAVGYTVWVALLLYYLGVLSEIGDILAEAKLPIGKADVSVLDLGRGALVVVIALVIALWLSSFIEQRLMQLNAGDRNVRAVMAKILRAVILLVAVLLALSSVGVDLTVLSVFGGALGVGIGLGLQKLASNYIAGFTILLDRSIRLGDMVTVDNRYGVVSKVTARYVVVRSLTGVEAIVPNEVLVVTTVLNHSYSTKDIQLTLPVQISYDSDVEAAIKLLAELAAEHARVLPKPLAPSVNVVRFADSGIDIEVGVWISDPENGQGNLKSDLYRSILKAFKANGIEIPYPRREVHVLREDGSPAPLPATGGPVGISVR